MLSMQGQIQQQNDFKNKIYNNPINLINAIKEQTLNHQDTIYELEIIDFIDAFPVAKKKRTKNFTNTQKDSNLPNNLLNHI